MVGQNLDGGHRHLRGVEPSPDVAAEAVQHGLDVDLADALDRPREEGVHGHKLARGMNFDVGLAELGVEALARLDLFLGELDLALVDRLLQLEQSLVAGLEAVADPHALHPARTDLEPS